MSDLDVPLFRDCEVNLSPFKKLVIPTRVRASPRIVPSCTLIVSDTPCCNNTVVIPNPVSEGAFFGPAFTPAFGVNGQISARVG